MKNPINYINNTQLLLSMKEAKRVLNGCGAEPVERYFSLTDFEYQMDVEECLRILNELHDSVKEEGVKEL